MHHKPELIVTSHWGNNLNRNAKTDLKKCLKWSKMTIKARKAHQLFPHFSQAIRTFSYFTSLCVISAPTFLFFSSCCAGLLNCFCCLHPVAAICHSSFLKSPQQRSCTTFCHSNRLLTGCYQSACIPGLRL